MLYFSFAIICWFSLFLMLEIAYFSQFSFKVVYLYGLKFKRLK